MYSYDHLRALGEEALDDFTKKCDHVLAQHGQGPQPGFLHQRCPFCQAYRLVERGACAFCVNCGTSSGCAG